MIDERVKNDNRRYSKPKRTINNNNKKIPINTQTVTNIEQEKFRKPQNILFPLKQKNFTIFSGQSITTITDINTNRATKNPIGTSKNGGKFIISRRLETVGNRN